MLLLVSISTSSCPLFQGLLRTREVDRNGLSECRCLLIVGIIFSWCLAEAKNRINDVLFEPGEDTASFLLVTSEPVSPEQVEKLADGIRPWSWFVFRI